MQALTRGTSDELVNELGANLGRLSTLPEPAAAQAAQPLAAAKDEWEHASAHTLSLEMDKISAPDLILRIKAGMAKLQSAGMMMSPEQAEMLLVDCQLAAQFGPQIIPEGYPGDPYEQYVAHLHHLALDDLPKL